MTFPIAGSSGFGNTVGQAFIVFHADTKSVPKDLQDELQRTEKAVSKTVTKMGQKWGKDVSESMSDELSSSSTVKAVEKALKNTFSKNDVVNAATVKVKVDVDGAAASRAGALVGNQFSRAFDNALRRNRTRGGGGGNLFGSLFSGLGGVLGAIIPGGGGGRSGGGGGGGGGGGFLSSLGGFAQGPLKIFSALGSSIGNVGSRGGPLGAAVGAGIVALIMGIVGAVAALINVLGPMVNAIFLLPAGVATLAAAIVPLVVAFNGMGEAVSAILSGDLEAINEALKDMGPNAQRAAYEMAGLVPVFKRLQTSVQESFFGAIAEGRIGQLESGLVPRLEAGMDKVAASAGHFVDSLLKLSYDPTVSKFLDMLFDAAAALFSNTESGFSKFLIGLADLGIATLPWINKLTELLGKKGGEFGKWLSDISKDGRLDGFLDKMVIALGYAWQLASSAWDFVKAIVGASGDEGRATEFLNLVIWTIQDLTKFFESDLGKESIKGMVLMAEALVIALGVIVALFAIMGMAAEGVRIIIAGIVDLVREFLQLLNIIAEDHSVEYAGGAGARRMGKAASGLGGAIGFAEGGIITSRIDGATVGEAGPEAIIPLSDPHRAMELMTQSGLMDLARNGNGGGINFGPGSIQIVFQGVVPTQQEAYRTGVAVADGISATLAKRDTRLAVRTL